MKSKLLLLSLIVCIGSSVKAQISNIKPKTTYELPKRSFHIDLASILHGDYLLGYEQFLNERVSLELRASMLTEPFYIREMDRVGIAISVGPKINLFQPRKGENVLKRFFVKPTLRYVSLMEHLDNNNNNSSHFESVELGLNFGHRWVWSDRFFLEQSIGFNTSYHLQNNYLNHSHSKVSYFPTLNLTFGILLYK